jgi:aminoglycoside phosphotransferase (APT) family kinase protein
VPVPQPIFAVPEEGCIAYVKLPGVPLLDLPRHQWSDHAPSIAATLGELLTALHAVPASRMTDLVDPDEFALTEWLREAAGAYPAVASRVPPAHRPPIESFLAAPPPDDKHVPVFSHRDLGIEHVLVDPVVWTVTGIIDWSDAAIVDPAYDFGLVYRDLGPEAFRAAIGTGPHDLTGLRERAAFYARCTVFEDLAYGIDTGQHKYVEKSVTAMGWLFPAS